MVKNSYFKPFATTFIFKVIITSSMELPYTIFSFCGLAESISNFSALLVVRNDLIVFKSKELHFYIY